MLMSSTTYIRPTTFGWSSRGARSVASASPTVWIVCTPPPTIRKASAAEETPSQKGWPSA